MKFVTVGNCQAQEIATWMQALAGATTLYHRGPKLADPASEESREALQDCDAVFAMPGTAPAFIEAAIAGGVPVHEAPRVFFTGFHPDVVYPVTSSAQRNIPLGNSNSAILLHAWREGLSAKEALRLYDERVYVALGYKDNWSLAVDALIAEGRARDLDFEPMLADWLRDGVFMHQPLHPYMSVMKSISTALLARAGAPLLPEADRTPVEDVFARNAVFPVYPEIASWIGVEGDYVFKPKNTLQRTGPGFDPLDLEEFLARTYEIFEEEPPELAAFPRLKDPAFGAIERFVEAARDRPRERKASNPYKDKPDTAFWRKSVADLPMEAVDPMTGPAINIQPETTIVTAGSCFAQHISRTLQAAGYRYLVTEDAPVDATAEFRAAGNYGVFSARYGNIYTTRQLVQLVDRAYGDFSPAERVWPQANGRFVDPFRPEIQAGGFETAEAVIAAQDVHLAAVREALEAADVFVFTLGLTEAWVSRSDGAVVPLAPGVARATVDPAGYRPVNYGIDKVRADLAGFVSRLEKINPSAKIILTVSPVPLIATFGNAHVLTATTYSKSVLRVAAQACADQFKHVEYFPSYEVITGSFNRGRYFEDDLRSVTPEGVAHVMRLFMKHHTDAAPTQEPVPSPGQTPSPSRREASLRAEISAGMEIVCDEEKIVAGLV
jgi:hypothetical protein